MRVAPGRVDEGTAIRRAKMTAKIFDETILSKTEAERWGHEDSIPFGIQQKKG